MLEYEDVRMKTHCEGTTLWLSFYKPEETV